MSPRFFYTFGLTIFFASMNLFSMEKNQLSKSLGYSKHIEKKNLNNNKYPLFKSPTSLLKQQSISLEGNSTDLHSLLFNRKEQPFITHYLLNGKSIGRLTQINNEINFKSNETNSPKFSLHIPYKAGSLTLTTQGALIFEGALYTHSAYLKSKTVDFFNNLISNNGLIIEADQCKSHAQLICSDFLFNGKEYTNASRSSLIAKNSATLIADSSVFNEGKIDCKKECFIKSPLCNNNGDVSSHAMIFNGNKVINSGTLTLTDSFHCATKLFEHSGMLDVFNNFIIEKADSFSSTPSSSLNVNGNWKSFITSLLLQGSVSVKNMHFAGKHFTSTPLFHGIIENASLKIQEDMINEGIIKVLGSLEVDAQNIKLTTTSDITAENADLTTSQSIRNDGTISIKNNLAGHAHSISNKGKINSYSATIKADRYLYNSIFSTLSAKTNLTIHTPISINLLGCTHAQYLTLNCAVGLNALGMYAAKNLNINSFFSANAGLFLPKFSSFAEMYSLQNIWGLGESLFIKHVPMYGTLYSTAKNIQGLYHQGRSICSEIGSVYKKGNLRTADFIALLCLTKSMVSSGQQTYQLGNQSYSLLSNISENNRTQNSETVNTPIADANEILPQLPLTFASTYNPFGPCISNTSKNNPQQSTNPSDDVIPTANEIVEPLPSTLISQWKNSISTNPLIAKSSEIVQQLPLTLLSHYGPSVSTNTLTNYDYGAAIGINNYSKSFLSDNASASLYVNNTIDIWAGRVGGYLGAYNLNINMHHGDIDAKTKAKNIHIKSDYLIKICASALLASSHTFLDCKGILQKGLLTGAVVIIKSNSVENAGKIKSPKVIIAKTELDDCNFDGRITKNKFCNSGSGSIEALELLKVDALNVDLETGSHISTKDGRIKSEGYYRDKSGVQAEQLLIEAKEDATHSGEMEISKYLQVKARNGSFDEHSVVNAKDSYIKTERDTSCEGVMNVEKGTIEAGGNVKVIGKTGASDQFGINAENITVEETANFHADKACLRAKESIINHSNNVAISDLFAHAKYVKNSGKIKTKKAYIKADRYLWNKWKSSIEGEENLTIDATLLLNMFGTLKGNNTSKSSIISLNTGIIMPSFEALQSLTWTSIQESLTRESLKKSLESGVKSITWQNAWNISHLTATQVLPRLAPLYCPALIPVCAALKIGCTVIRLGENVYRLSRETPKLYGKSQYIYSKYQNNDLYMSDALPLLCQSKNFFSSAVQTGSQGYKLGSDIYQGDIFSSTPNNETKSENIIDNQAKSDNINTSVADLNDGYINNIDINISDSTGINIPEVNLNNIINNDAISAFDTWVSVGKTYASYAASNVGPKLSSDSLIDINAGLILGMNGNSESLYNANLGASVFAHNNSISTVSGTNTGLVGGVNTSINASESYSNSGTSYADTFSMKTKKLQLEEHSKIKARTASVEAQSIKGEKGNTISTSNGTGIKTNELDNGGSINGPLGVEFTGTHDQLKQIGNVEHLTYSGTLDNGLADTLVNGHNDVLNVSSKGSVGINAGTQDVHLKEEHNTSHAFSVETEGSARFDKNLSSQQSIALHAKGDLNHASVESKETTSLKGHNISSEGHTTREKQGDNYKDVATESKVSGKQVIIDAKNNLNYKGTHVHSGTGGTKARVGNNLNSDTLKLEERRTSEHQEMGSCRKNKEQSFTKQEDTFTTHAPSTFSSEGKTEICVQNTANLAATVFDSAGGTTIEAKLFVEKPVYDTHTQKVEARTREFLKTEKSFTESHSETLCPIKFKETTPPTIISENPVSLHVECAAPSITVNAPKVELLLTTETTTKASTEHNVYGNMWERAKNKESHDTIHGPSYDGTLNTNAQAIHIQHNENSAPAIINPTSGNPGITYTPVKNVHEYHEEVVRSRPTPLLINGLALAASVGTQGLIAPLGIGFKAALAGINAFVLNTAQTLLQCDGNYKDAAKKIITRETIRDIGLAALISGATLGADQGLNKYISQLSQATTFPQCLLFTASREVVHGGIRSVGDIARGQNPREAIKRNAKETAADILGITLSSKIGQLYATKKINSLTHKLLHAGLGAAEGAILDGKRGALAGAIGAGAAETIADIARPKPPSLESILQFESQIGRTLTESEFSQELNRQTIEYLKQAQSIGNASKIMGAAAATLANQDMNIAYNTGSKAVDHNFLILIGGAVTGISVGYSAYKIQKAYEEKGSIEALRLLGIEVAWSVAGAGAGKLLFKVGPYTFRSATTAVNVVLDAYPTLKLFLGNTAETLITGAQHLARTGMAQKVGRGAQKLINLDNKITNKVENFTNHIANKLEKQINPSLAEDLVEQIVPATVLNNVEQQLVKKSAKKGASQLALPAPQKHPLLAAPESLQTKKSNNHPTLRRSNKGKEAGKSSRAHKREKSIQNDSTQNKAQSLAQPSLDEIKPAVISPDSVLQQHVAVSMKEIAEQGIINAQHSLNILEKNVETWAKSVSHERVGRLLNVNISCIKFDQLESEAKLFYDLMRSTNNDINAIAKNTGINEQILNQIKNHVFFEEHILNTGIMRFDPCVDMAAAWKRLINGNFVYSDLVLLQHELAESFAMQKTKIPYRIAHDVVNKIYNWEKSYIKDI